MKKAVLLVNLGTPDSPHPKDVHKYLIEFLTDERVIDKPWGFRQLLVRGFIVPMRYKQSAKSYKEIWTKEGSPLMVYSRQAKKLLQSALGNEYHVELAMRYQSPSIESALERVMKEKPAELIVVPLFPQYASATTGSVHQKILELVSKYQVIPKLKMINSFATNPSYIDAVCETASDYPLDTYDHFLFSFHGLPKRHLTKANSSCLTSKNCCDTLCSNNQSCYLAECKRSAFLIAEKLGITNYSIAFQSRLGKEPWIEPFTIDELKKLVDTGHKKVLVFCPSFVADCLETIFEIGVEYKEEFIKHGGERLDYVKSLNDHPKWIDALESLVKK